MSSALTYKGYTSKIEFSVEDSTLFGKIEGINDLVTFESDSASTIEKEFHSAVDDYLAYCKEVGKEPEKPFKGSFNIRATPEIHRALAVEAMKTGKSLNSLVVAIFENYLSYTDDYEHSDKFPLHMSKSLHKKVAELAATEGVSINSFIVEAVAEKAGSEPTINVLDKMSTVLAQFANVVVGTTAIVGAINVFQQKYDGWNLNRPEVPFLKVGGNKCVI